MTDPRQPVPQHHHIEIPTVQIGIKVHAPILTVTRVEQLAPALAQRQQPVVIDNPKIEQSLERFYARERTIRMGIFAFLVGWIVQQAIAHQLKIDISLLHDWKANKTEGKLTLTPRGWKSEVLRQAPSINE